VSRETATKDGKTASASADARPASLPKRGVTTRYRSATASTPQTASGMSRLSGEKPKIFALSACSHSPSGGLSTVIRPLGSAVMKKKSCQDCSIDLTAAE
jgi:hypothetical protein